MYDIFAKKVFDTSKRRRLPRIELGTSAMFAIETRKQNHTTRPKPLEEFKETIIRSVRALTRKGVT